jgi:hypothetical protein
MLLHGLSIARATSAVQFSPGLHIDYHDAALRLVGFFVVFLLGPIVLTTPAVVAHGNLEPRLLMATALFFLAAADLFDDPGFEHGDETSS